MKPPKFPRGCMVMATPHWRDEPFPAVVEGTYAELYPGGGTTEYVLLFEELGRQAWFNESQLTLVKDDALEEWRAWGLKRLADE